MKIWGIHKKYSSLSWWENFMGGHLSIGPLTIWGANAMNWAVNVKTRWGYLCFTLPVKARWEKTDNGKFKRWYIYLSPNGTPWAATWYRGCDKNERIRADIRRFNFGHNFSTSKYRDELSTVNNKFSWFQVSEYDMSEFGPKDRGASESLIKNELGSEITEALMLLAKDNLCAHHVFVGQDRETCCGPDLVLSIDDQIRIIESQLNHFDSLFEKMAYMYKFFDHDEVFTKEARDIVRGNIAGNLKTQ